MVAEARARLSLDGSQFDKELKRTAEQSEKTMGPSMKKIGGMIAGAFSVRAIYQFIDGAMKAADEVDNLSKRLNIGVEATQALQVAADEMGLAIGDVQAVMLKLQSGTARAIEGNTQLADAFSSLGVSMSDMQSLSPEEMLDRVAQAMYRGKDSSEVMNAAVRVFGEDTGPKMKALLEQIGQDGLPAMIDQFKELGQVLSEDTITALDQAEEKTSRFFTSVRNSAVTGLAGLITIWEDFFTSLDEGFDATDEGYKATIAHIEEVTQRKLAEQKAAQEAVNEAAEQQAKIYGDISALEKELSALTADRVPTQRSIIDIEREIFGLEVERETLTGDTVENYRRQLEIDIEIAKKQNEISDIQAKVAKDREIEDKRREAAARERQTLEEKYARIQFDQLSVEERITRTQQALNEKLAAAKALKDAGNESSDEFLRLMIEAHDIQGDLARLEQERLRGQKAVLDITEQQVENVKALRDQFQGMTEEDIKDFVDRLSFLAQQLNGIIAPDLGWIKDLQGINNIRFSGLTTQQASQMARAIREFVDTLNRGTAGIKIDAGWIKDLEAISNLKFTGLTRGQASQMAGALVELAAGLAKIGGLKNLGDITKLIEAIGNLGPGGKHEIILTLPDGMTDGVPLLLPEGMNDSLKSISQSLNTIKGWTGVVFA